MSRTITERKEVVDQLKLDILKDIEDMQNNYRFTLTCWVGDKLNEIEQIAFDRIIDSLFVLRYFKEYILKDTSYMSIETVTKEGIIIWAIEDDTIDIFIKHHRKIIFNLISEMIDPEKGIDHKFFEQMNDNYFARFTGILGLHWFDENKEVED